MLKLISHIADNHIRNFYFNLKIERILQLLEINKYLSNRQIFDIFKNNKQILLFLFKEKILIIDEYIANQMNKDQFKQLKYPEFFFNEIKPFLNSNYVFNFSLSKNQMYYGALISYPHENRNIDENEDFFCNLIRKDLIKEFIVHVSKTNMKLERSIQRSIIETNSFLFDKTLSLIEYAAFFGSIQIFKYLMLNHVKMTPS